MGRTAASRGEVASALNVALKAIKVAPADGASVALAVRLAQKIDETTDPGELGTLSARLLAALAALRMTPASRDSIVREVASGPASGGRSGSSAGGRSIDELRSRRVRMHPAAAVDTPTSGADA